MQLMRALVRLRRSPSMALLVVQLLALLSYPFIGDHAVGQVASTAVSAAVLSVAVWMVHRSPRPGWIAGTLAAVGIVAWALHQATGGFALGVIGSIGYAAAFFYAAVSMIAYMMSDEQTTTDEMWAAGATFMLFVEAYAWVFMACQLFQPNAFSAPLQNAQPVRTWVELLFLSGTNFSATGLGDILPMTPLSRIVIVVAQWNGVMYLAVVVARLAGLLRGKRNPGSRDPG